MAAYAHFVLQKLGIMPSVFAEMDVNEKAFVIASVRRRIDEENRLRDELYERFGKGGS